MHLRNSTQLKTILLATSILLLSGCKGKQIPTVLSLEEEMSFIKEALGTLRTASDDALLKAEETEQPLYLLPFENPPEVVAQNGVLDTQLDIAYATNRMYNVKDKKNVLVDLRSYNGRLVGPTLRISQGDLLRVKLNNNLPPLTDVGVCDPYAGHMHGSGDDCDQLDPLKFNTTNLHQSMGVDCY